MLKNKFLSQRFLCEFRIGSLKSSARLAGAFEDFSGEIILVLPTYIRHFHSSFLSILSQIWKNIVTNMEKYFLEYGEILSIITNMDKYCQKYEEIYTGSGNLYIPFSYRLPLSSLSKLSHIFWCIYAQNLVFSFVQGVF